MAQSDLQVSRSRIRREGAIFALMATLFLALSFATASSAQDEKPAAPEGKAPAAANAAGGTKKGEEIFRSKCIICHNKLPGDSSPFGPPNLWDAFKTKAVTPAQAEQI